MLLHHLPAASQNRSYYLSPPLVLSVSRLHVVQVEPPYSTSFLGYTPYLLTNCGNMRRRSLVEDSSGFSLKSGSVLEESDHTGPTDDGVDSDTDLTDVDAFPDKDDGDKTWLFPNEDHPPEYYLQQLEIFNEQEYAKEDYKDSSTRLLNRMEEQWNQYVSCSLVACARIHELIAA